MNGQDYSAYILSAYGVSLIVIAALGLWIALDSRMRRHEMKRLEESGLRRRSGLKAP